MQCAYAAADVFVTPSICFDTFGLVNLEAMRYAKPVVASCFGGLPEVVVDGETGFIENPFDVQAFSDRLRILLDQPDGAVPSLSQRVERRTGSSVKELFARS